MHPAVPCSWAGQAALRPLARAPAAARTSATPGRLAGGSGRGSKGANKACRTLDKAAAPATAVRCPS